MPSYFAFLRSTDWNIFPRRVSYPLIVNKCFMSGDEKYVTFEGHEDLGAFQSRFFTFVDSTRPGYKLILRALMMGECWYKERILLQPTLGPYPTPDQFVAGVLRDAKFEQPIAEERLKKDAN